MKKESELFLCFASLSVMSLIVSNLLAVKLTTFLGIAVDCGILLYPISYIVGDLSVEFFGEKPANRIVLFSTIMNVLAVIILQIAVWLPAHSGWSGQSSYAFVFGATIRIVAASVAAYLLSGFVNNHLFAKLRARGFTSSALGSSALAHLVDSAVFETIAFLGILPFRDFLAQALFAYCAAFAIEAVLFLFVTKPLARRIHTWLEH